MPELSTERDQWLLSWPLDDLNDNPSEQDQSAQDSQADSASFALNDSDGMDAGAGLISAPDAGEGISGGAEGGAVVSCDGGCGM